MYHCFNVEFYCDHISFYSIRFYSGSNVGFIFILFISLWLVYMFPLFNVIDWIDVSPTLLIWFDLIWFDYFSAFVFARQCGDFFGLRISNERTSKNMSERCVCWQYTCCKKLGHSQRILVFHRLWKERKGVKCRKNIKSDAHAHCAAITNKNGKMIQSTTVNYLLTTAFQPFFSIRSSFNMFFFVFVIWLTYT